jgi:hypothetical protein
MIVWYLMLELFRHCSFYFFILFSIYLFFTNWKCEYLSIAWKLHGAILFTLDIYCTINGGYLWYYMYVKKHIVWNNISPVFVQTNPTSSDTKVYYFLKHTTLLEYPFLSSLSYWPQQKTTIVYYRSIMALKAIIDRQSILEQNNVLAAGISLFKLT